MNNDTAMNDKLHKLILTRRIDGRTFEVYESNDPPPCADISRPYCITWYNNFGTQYVWMPSMTSVHQVFTRFHYDHCTYAWDILAHDRYGDLQVAVVHNILRVSNEPGNRYIGKWGGPNPGMITACSYSTARIEAQVRSVIAAHKAS